MHSEYDIIRRNSRVADPFATCYTEANNTKWEGVDSGSKEVDMFGLQKKHTSWKKLARAEC